MRTLNPRALSCWPLLIPTLVLLHATAQAGVLVCQGPESTDYSPGIQNQPRSVTFTGQGNMNLCLGLLTTQGVTVKRVVSTGTASISCAANNSPAPSSLKIYWSDGTSSDAVGMTVVNSKPAGQLVLEQEAEVTSNDRFKGVRLTRVLTSAQLDVTACASANGVTHVDGSDELVLYGPNL